MAVSGFYRAPYWTTSTGPNFHPSSFIFLLQVLLVFADDAWISRLWLD